MSRLRHWQNKLSNNRNGSMRKFNLEESGIRQVGSIGVSHGDDQHFADEDQGDATASRPWPIGASTRPENMPVHVRRHARSRSVGPHVEPSRT